MTRQELYKEIKKIDGFIEILQGFINNPICACISHVNNTNKKFTQENKEHLQSLVTIRKFLLLLGEETDRTLADLHYDPVKFICQKEAL